MQKIISVLFILLITASQVSAETVSKMLNKMGVNKSAISVSIKNLQNGEKIYSLNDKKPMIPASTLKIITSSSAVDTLGENYIFSTKMYKSTNNDLYIKLVGDPFLKSKDLEKLITDAKSKNIIEPKNVYIDNTIFDNVEWGEGWQWDDDLNPLMPKFSAYNLDGNLLKLEIFPTINNAPAKLDVNPSYPLVFMNYTTTNLSAKLNDINLERNNSIAPNMINISGTVAKSQIVNIPNNNPKMYFILRLEEAIRNKRMEYYNPITTMKLPSKNIYLVGQVDHSLSDALTEILQNSNNMFAETVFKLAGAKYSNKPGSIKNSTDMLKTYLTNLDLNIDDIKIVDGSGVSKNNLINADFMTEFLLRQKDNDFLYDHMSDPGMGTLKNRMLYFKNNLKAKTGTLSDISAITGFLKTRKGKTLVFDIMISDPKTSSSDKKNIEEQILRNIYMNY